MTWLFVAFGSAIGGMLRYGVARVMPIAPAGWAIGTLFVNVLGSFLIGLLYPWVAARGVTAENARLFWMTGVLGGFTTYSAFALETSLLGAGGDWIAAASYTALTVIACLLAALAGRALAMAWT
ncbi:MAG: CrcB family protein [Steroidobacteraceae bacterium]